MCNCRKNKKTNEDQSNLGARSVTNNDPHLAMVHTKPSLTSPNPSPRTSLEEKDQVIKQQIIPPKLKQTSPIAKIRQFVGVDDIGNDEHSNAMMNKIEVASGANGNSTGNFFHEILE